MIRTVLAAACAAALLATLAPGAYADDEEMSAEPVEVKAKRIRIVVKKDGETAREVVVDEDEDDAGAFVAADGEVIVLDGNGERIELGNLDALIRQLWSKRAESEEDGDVEVWEFDAEDGRVRARRDGRRRGHRRRAMRGHLLKPAVRRLMLRRADDEISAILGEPVPHAEGSPARRPGPDRLSDADAHEILRHIMAILHHHLHGHGPDAPHRATPGHRMQRPRPPQAPKTPRAPRMGFRRAPQAGAGTGDRANDRPSDGPRRGDDAPRGALQQILHKLDRMEGRLEDLDRRLKALENGTVDDNAVKVVRHPSGDVRIRYMAPDGTIDAEGLMELKKRVEEMARETREKAKDAGER